MSWFSPRSTGTSGESTNEKRRFHGEEPQSRLDSLELRLELPTQHAATQSVTADQQTGPHKAHLADHSSPLSKMILIWLIVCEEPRASADVALKNRARWSSTPLPPPPQPHSHSSPGFPVISSLAKPLCPNPSPSPVLCPVSPACHVTNPGEWTDSIELEPLRELERLTVLCRPVDVREQRARRRRSHGSGSEEGHRPCFKTTSPKTPLSFVLSFGASLFFPPMVLSNGETETERGLRCTRLCEEFYNADWEPSCPSRVGLEMLSQDGA